MSDGLTWGHLFQLGSSVVVAIGLYWGVRIDLARLEEKRNETQRKAEDAHELAGEAHEKIYKHVEDFHTRGV